MKIHRYAYAPLLLAPLVLFVGHGRNTQQESHETSTEIAHLSEPTSNQKIDQVDSIQDLPLLPLAPDQIKTFNDMLTFLETFTGPSHRRLNYGSIDKMAQGICEDVTTINLEGKIMLADIDAKVKDGTISEGRAKLLKIKANAAIKYPDNFGFINNGVISEVTARTREEMIADFNKFGVDPNTETAPDDSPIMEPVTKGKLEKYRDDALVYKTALEKDVGIKPGQRLIFREGISDEDIKFVLERRRGLPPGAEIVDNNSVVTAKN